MQVFEASDARPFVRARNVESEDTLAFLRTAEHGGSLRISKDATRDVVRGASMFFAAAKRHGMQMRRATRDGFVYFWAERKAGE